MSRDKCDEFLDLVAQYELQNNILHLKIGDYKPWTSIESICTEFFTTNSVVLKPSLHTAAALCAVVASCPMLCSLHLQNTSEDFDTVLSAAAAAAIADQCTKSLREVTISSTLHSVFARAHLYNIVGYRHMVYPSAVIDGIRILELSGPLQINNTSSPPSSLLKSLDLLAPYWGQLQALAIRNQPYLPSSELRRLRMATALRTLILHDVPLTDEDLPESILCLTKLETLALTRVPVTTAGALHHLSALAATIQRSIVITIHGDGAHWFRNAAGQLKYQCCTGNGVLYRNGHVTWDWREQLCGTLRKKRGKTMPQAQP